MSGEWTVIQYALDFQGATAADATWQFETFEEASGYVSQAHGRAQERMMNATAYVSCKTQGHAMGFVARFCVEMFVSNPNTWMLYEVTRGPIDWDEVNQRVRSWVERK